MKYIKMLGLLALAAAALTAFVGTASATTATSPKGTVYTGTYRAEAEGAISLESSFFVTVTCGRSIVEGKVEQHGSGVTTIGKIALLSFSECTDDVTVLKSGSLEAHATSIKGTDADGTVTSTGFEAVIHTSVGECVVSTKGTDIGTGSLTSTGTTGGNATLDVKSASIPITGGSFFCPSSAVWTGSYKVVTPKTLYIDA